MSEFAACYLTFTAVMAAMQFVENLVNGDAGKHYAPVWWIAITWPSWRPRPLPFLSLQPRTTRPQPYALSSRPAPS